MSLHHNLWYALVALILLANVSDYICVLRLKSRHHGLWASLGRPGFWGTQAKFALRRLGYFYSGRFLELRDGVLTFFFFLTVAATAGAIVSLVYVEIWVSKPA